MNKYENTIQYKMLLGIHRNLGRNPRTKLARNVSFRHTPVSKGHTTIEMETVLG